MSANLAGGGASTFRNVSACNRCRLRKNRCDQRLPRCLSCEKAGVRCVGYDPITKREIPRSYVYFLEARVAYLERLLRDNGIDFKEAVAFEGEEAVEAEGGANHANAQPVSSGNSAADGTSPTNDKLATLKTEKDDSAVGRVDTRHDGGNRAGRDVDRERRDEERLDNLVSNIGMVSVQGTSDTRYLGSTSGISFARLVFAAVKSSVSGNVSDRGTANPSERLRQSATGTAGSTMRDSFFGLQTRPMMKCAEFPDRDLARKLAELYFEHANPQMPILHRVDFMELFDRAYSSDEKNLSARDLYVLNIVFAIGAGIIYEGKSSTQGDGTPGGCAGSPSSKRQGMSGHQYQPEEYHASAIVHLESFLGSSSSDGHGGLEELQAVLLLAGFALLRPVAPGLWYIVGVAVRLAIDLGLHYEDGTGIDSIGEEGIRPPVKGGDSRQVKIDPHERGRREWVRDFRRRLWWCVYSFDRLVSTCVGRPFGIPDQVITTEFPSLLDDEYITKAGFVTPPKDAPSYKHVAHHYLKLRLLQSEIQQVLQYQQARLTRQAGKNSRNTYMHTRLPSPYLQGFDSFHSWRKDVHRRLAEWIDSAPTREKTGVQFSLEFLELNYWQAVIMLYRQGLTVPAPLAGEPTPADDVSSPSFSHGEEPEDEDDIYMNIAEAGQRILRIYRQLHLVRLVNYTYLATHHLFMAGISFLYAIWHSPVVRSRLTLDEVDFTVLAATSVLEDLMEKCPPAEACRDAFDRMSKAIIQMCLSTTGFGSQAGPLGRGVGAPIPRPLSSPYLVNPRSRQRSEPTDHQQLPTQSQPQQQAQLRPPRPVPRFDLNPRDTFDCGSPHSGKRPRVESYDQFGYPARPTVHFKQEVPRQHRPGAQYMQSYHQYNTSSPQQQQFFYASSPQSASSGSAPQNFNQPPQVTESENLTAAGSDFVTFATGGGQTVDFGFGSGTDYDMFMPSLGQGGAQGTGLDLGFGMAVDFQHDWSEGTDYNMFGDYFFSGAGGANNGP
ncbi:hypothetical protein VTN02DRAFT_5950 [Thermoascus thermophilus]